MEAGRYLRSVLTMMVPMLMVMVMNALNMVRTFVRKIE